jgi:hypothetical protein
LSGRRSDDSKQAGAIVSKEKLISKLEELRTLAEECLVILAEESDPSHLHKKLPAPPEFTGEIDFEKPIRPFMKGYSAHMGGSKKFVLLVAWLSKGDLKKQVALSDVKKQWNQMTAILGMEFNRFFASDAKDRDWVETKAKGLYNLRPEWKDVLKKRE